jgi:hypothetical protein
MKLESQRWIRVPDWRTLEELGALEEWVEEEEFWCEVDGKCETCWW